MDRLASLVKILVEEKKRDYPDRVVSAGLSRYVASWRRLVLDLAPPLPLKSAAERLWEELASYGDMDRQERRHAVDRALPIAMAALDATRRPSAIDYGTFPSPESRPSLPGEQSRPATSSATPPGLSVDYETPVGKLPRVGQARARALARLGISTARDLLYHFPFRYKVYPPACKATDLLFMRQASFVGTVKDIQVSRTSRGINKITATLSDDTGTVSATWFRAGYGSFGARPGERIALSGDITTFGRHVVFENPDWERASGPPLHTRRIVPVYPSTSGLHEYWLRSLVKHVVDALAGGVPETLPEWVLKEQGLPPIPVALRQIHFPDSEASAHEARRRLAFDELLTVQLAVLRRRLEWQSAHIRPIPTPHQLLDRVAAAQPFRLTGAQQRVLAEICEDMAKPVPMTRLLQGEVGSGKTAVAALAALAAVAGGRQVMIMAPTEILAEQHHQTISQFYHRAEAALLGAIARVPTVLLLTGSSGKVQRQAAYAAAASGEADILVGTHALIQEELALKDLGLVIVDEQHRFGVRQRVSLRAKGENPHLLVMTATPIPRTLALSLYGDLDMSIIDEMPEGRQRVSTRLLYRDQRSHAYEEIRRQCALGHQAFVICPLIEDSPHLEAKAATREYERLLAGELRGLRLGLLHGRMGSQEKDRVMRLFRDGHLDVLVSTSVVEVGVDVPNATVMVVEGAERFGLAQLHQLRGRVGRSSFPAVCFLVTDQTDQEIVARLEAVVRAESGLRLAEEDLRLRGPGEYAGVRQSGFPEFKVAQLTDLDLMERARAVARRVLEQDPDLQRPEHAALKREVDRFTRRVTEPN